MYFNKIKYGSTSNAGVPNAGGANAGADKHRSVPNAGVRQTQECDKGRSFKTNPGCDKRRSSLYFLT